MPAANPSSVPFVHLKRHRVFRPMRIKPLRLLSNVNRSMYPGLCHLVRPIVTEPEFAIDLGTQAKRDDDGRLT